jgi:hypothetical protein
MPGIHVLSKVAFLRHLGVVLSISRFARQIRIAAVFGLLGRNRENGRGSEHRQEQHYEEYTLQHTVFLSSWPDIFLGLGKWGLNGLHARHFPAGLGAASAGCGALLHDRVVAKPLTVLSAALTDLSAHPASAGVQVGTAQHKICAGLADIGAV